MQRRQVFVVFLFTFWLIFVLKSLVKNLMRGGGLRNRRLSLTLKSTHFSVFCRRTGLSYVWAICNYFYQNGTSCENNLAGRYPKADGDLEMCMRYHRDYDIQYMVWWNNQCFGSLTCDTPYPTDGEISVYDCGACMFAFIVFYMMFLKHISSINQSLN